MLTFIRLLLVPVVFGCIGISAVFAFEFGWTKGATDVHRWAFGLAGGGLDLLKAALPVIAAAAALAHDRTKQLAAWFVFAWLTVMSLWCAYGTTAGQLAERIGSQAAAIATRNDATAKLRRLRDARAAVPPFTYATAESVAAADVAIAAAREKEADAKRAEAQECGRVGDNCRKRRAETVTAAAELADAIKAKSRAISDRAATEKAERLDADIAAAEAAVSNTDARAGSVDADPQAASLSKATGIEEQRIVLVSYLLFAIGIEAGSGFGLWLLLGHGHAPRRPEDDAGEAEAAPAAVPPPPVPEAPAEPVFGSRAHFFRECVFPCPGERIAAAVMYRAYQRFCARLGVEPMSAQVFGRDPIWRREKIGGSVYYLDCKLPADIDVLPVKPAGAHIVA